MNHADFHDHECCLQTGQADWTSEPRGARLCVEDARVVGAEQLNPQRLLWTGSSAVSRLPSPQVEHFSSAHLAAEAGEKQEEATGHRKQQILVIRNRWNRHHSDDCLAGSVRSTVLE